MELLEKISETDIIKFFALFNRELSERRFLKATDSKGLKFLDGIRN